MHQIINTTMFKSKHWTFTKSSLGNCCNDTKLNLSKSLSSCEQTPVKYIFTQKLWLWFISVLKNSCPEKFHMKLKSKCLRGLKLHVSVYNVIKKELHRKCSSVSFSIIFGACLLKNTSKRLLLYILLTLLNIKTYC